MDFRHSKIVCTIGPASRSPRMIDRLFSAGMDVARLNFSHGTHEEHARSMALLRAASGEHEKPVAILADLQGPKIRTGALAGGGPVMLRAGQPFVITTAKVLGDSTRVSTTFMPLPREVHRGDRILLSDGLIELRVQQVRDRQVICEVVNGGALGEHKGINLPGLKLRVPALTPKDRTDLLFALKHGANYIAVSFVRRPEDVLLARQLIRRAGKDTPIIAKLEKPEAIENLDEILQVADGVMVARGDLGVEMSPERVPVVQKTIIARAREFRRPVITATQMLESMTENPRPTRAEASDVANAIFDGSDAVMLSAETATGKYPVEAVSMMARIIEEAEGSIREFPRPVPQEQLKVAETVAELVCHASRELHMKLIAVFTHSGFTARLVSRYRPLVPIVAFSPEQETRRRLAMIWGVYPRNIQDVHKVDGLAPVAEKRLLEERLVRKGDVIGIVAGTPMGIRGTTNFMKFHVIGGPA
ncbi:MAG: pyruvate kinase [Acidobacteria bacterium]|nr:MAG: pyruvate kinase [Acidobacteria bacterium 13_1_40CM_4_58_4]PYT62480.1 MAG: pyruvate kinase [Acidobacteriota bacterium]